MNSPKIKTLAYFGLIRPLLEVIYLFIFLIYAATTWDPYTELNLECRIIVNLECRMNS